MALVLILFFIGLFWVIWSLRANGGTRGGDSGSSTDSGYIPGTTDDLGLDDGHHSHHHSGDHSHHSDSGGHDSGSSDGGGHSSH